MPLFVTFNRIVNICEFCDNATSMPVAKHNSRIAILKSSHQHLVTSGTDSPTMCRGSVLKF